MNSTLTALSVGHDHEGRELGIGAKAAGAQEIFGALKNGGILSVTEVLPNPDYQAAGTVLRLCRQTCFQPGSRYGHLIAYTFNFEKPGESGEGGPGREIGSAMQPAAVGGFRP